MPASRQVTFAREPSRRGGYASGMTSIIDHVSINVGSLDASVSFYERALSPLRISLLMRGASGVGFGRRKPELWLRQGTGTFQTDAQVATITPVHICFAAESPAEVDAFHQAALAAGGRDFGPPGLRSNYHAQYYGAFVLDPDGHNIEAVHHGKWS